MRRRADLSKWLHMRVSLGSWYSTVASSTYKARGAQGMLTGSAVIVFRSMRRRCAALALAKAKCLQRTPHPPSDLVVGDCPPPQPTCSLPSLVAALELKMSRMSAVLSQTCSEMKDSGQLAAC